ncbi:MAG: DUF2062 domain-containing protein [Parvibaculaceae bacterium]|nr:DUF2062 domain-containing protein [Parvibaculaceae bacterium]
MFRRRVPLHPIDRLRNNLWPRSGWKRALKYNWYRMTRLSGSPHGIAVGAAAGAFASCTPFLGLHVVSAVIIAWVLRGNFFAAAFGTFVGNPLTYPFIWLATYDIGAFVLGHKGGGPDAASVSGDLLSLSASAWHKVWPLFEPMMIGMVPVGLAAALITYGLVNWGVQVFRVKRHKRLHERYHQQQARHPHHAASRAAYPPGPVPIAAPLPVRKQGAKPGRH